MRDDARSWLILLALAALALDIGGATSRPGPPLPLVGPGLVGRALPLTDGERVQLAGAPATKRQYRIDGRTVRALAVDASANRHAVHDPGYCLVGRGYERVSREELATPRGPVLVDRYRRGAERLVLVHFHVARGRRSTSRIGYLVDFLRARVDREHAAGLTWNLAEVEGEEPGDAWLMGRALAGIFD